MRAPSTSGSSVELLLRVIDVKYGYFTLVYFYFLISSQDHNVPAHLMIEEGS